MGSAEDNTKITTGGGIVCDRQELKVQALKKRRVRIILLNLIYFIALLCIGLVMFFRNAGYLIYIPAAAAVLVYIFFIRKMLKEYEYDLREAILRGSVLTHLESPTYDRRGGISYQYLIDAGFINVINASSYLSRELIRGTKADMDVQLADVTFPVREDGLNKMFSGCLIHIESGSAQFEQLDVKAGDHKAISDGELRRLVKKLGSFIPGSLYLHSEGNSVDILLRARFIGFQINPLGEVSGKLLESDPLPELGQALALAEKLKRPG